MALGDALPAGRPDASAAACNPAQITALPGSRVMIGASAFLPRGKIEWTDRNGVEGFSACRRQTWFMPHAYATRQINDDWWLGVGEFSRYGLGLTFDDWPGRFAFYSASVKSVSLNPVVAWRATDRLSLAAGVELISLMVGMKSRKHVGVPGMPGASFEVDARLDGDDPANAGVGWNAAAHFRISDHWAVGAHYRSQAEVKLRGRASFSWAGSEGVPDALAGAVFQGCRETFRDGKAHARIILPDSMSVGLAWMPGPNLSVEATAKLTRWSSFKSLDIYMPNNLSARRAKKWKDSWRIGVGVEYDPLDWLTLRAGCTFDQSPQRDSLADYMAPTGDRHIVGLGIGLRRGDWSLDLACSHIQPAERTYGVNPATDTVKSRARDNVTRTFTLSFGYAF